MIYAISNPDARICVIASTDSLLGRARLRDAWEMAARGIYDLTAYPDVKFNPMTGDRIAGSVA